MASRINRPGNLPDSGPDMEDHYEANEGQNSRLARKPKRPMIGEMGGGLLELTPWHEDSARGRDHERDGRDRKRYNHEAGGGGTGAALAVPGADMK